MEGVFRPLLEKSRIFSTTNSEELVSFLESKDFRLDYIPDSTRKLDARFNGVYMPGMYLGYIQYGPEVSVRAVSRDEYWLQMPVYGQLEITGRSSCVVCSQERAAIASPTNHNYYNVHSKENSGGIRLCFYKSAMMDCLATMLGEQPNNQLVFSSEFDLTTSQGRSFVHYVKCAIDDFDEPESLIRSEAVMNVFQQLIMTSLLTVQQHNFSNTLQLLDVSVAPRDIKKAIEFIHTYYSTPISIGDIVAVTGVPGRTLFKHFRDYKGVSPIQYLNNLRFEIVRQRLIDADAGETVTRIAMNAGFMHMGRFAVEYKRRYGETPSETLMFPKK